MQPSTVWLVVAVAIAQLQCISAATCENIDVEYPKGIENPDGGDGLLLPNIAYNSDYIFTGGRFDSEIVYEGGQALRNS